MAISSSAGLQVGVRAAVTGLLAGLGAVGLGAPTWAVGVVTVAAASIVVVTLAQVERRLRKDWVEPLEVAARQLDVARTGQLSTRLPGSAAEPVALVLRRLSDVVGVVLDQSRQSQAQLLSVEVAFDRIHAVLHALDEGVAVVDTAGDIVLANPRARELLAADGSGPLEGSAIVARLPGSLREAVGGALDELRTGETQQVRHAVGLTVGDRVFDVQVNRVRSNRPDRDFGYVVVFVDVTRAHEVARLKDGFLSSMSHELRTPLTNICAYAEILETGFGGEVDPESAEFLRVIHSEGHHLAALVDDVLDYTKLETGEAVFRVESVELAEIVASVVDAARPRAAASGVDLEVRTLASGRVPAVSFDARRLEQIVAKLVDNAIKFGPEEGGRVLIELDRASSHAAELRVHDQGPGLAPEDRERVFDRLLQLGDPFTDKPAGAGLGLAICRRVLTALGGSIECGETSLGPRGACFRVVLPIAETDKNPPGTVATVSDGR